MSFHKPIYFSRDILFYSDFRLRRLNEGGLLHKMLEKYIPRGGCFSEKNTASSLSIFALQGLFIIVAILISICTLVLFLEIVHFKIKHVKVAPLHHNDHADTLFVKRQRIKEASQDEDCTEVTDL